MTVNGSSSWSCSSLINLEAGKIGSTVALSLLLVVSLIGKLLIVLIVYKTPTLRKPINMLIANMAMSDLLFPIFTFPVRLAYLHGGGGWLIGGNLGQALCKLHVFGTYISSLVSVQSLVLIDISGSIWSCCSSTSFPSHNYQAVSILHCRYVDNRDGRLFAISCYSKTC